MIFSDIPGDAIYGLSVASVQVDVLRSASQNADGIAMDAAGNLYVTTCTGIEAFAPDGKSWRKITTMDTKGAPIRTTNAAFGGEDLSTLYITGRSENLYVVKLVAP